MAMETVKKHWHTLEGAQALAELDSDTAGGLAGAEAARRLEQYGPNALAEGKKK